MLRASGRGGAHHDGHDPQVVVDPDRLELRLRRAHPIPIRHRDVSYAGDVAGRDRRRAPRHDRSRRRQLASNNAVSREIGHHCGVATVALVEHRGFVGGSGARVDRVDRQRAGFEQRVGPASAAAASTSKRSATKLIERAPPGLPSPQLRFRLLP